MSQVGRVRSSHHFESVCLDAEVRVVLVALDHAGLHTLSSALNESLRPIHREELHLLHFPNSPEENLRKRPAEPSPQIHGGAPHLPWLCVEKLDLLPENHAVFLQERTAQLFEGSFFFSRSPAHSISPLLQFRWGHCP
ncbi:chromosome 8 open reading frame 78, isoform CRA_a [Homo sapiens]|jgi:hypothetical protein|uniref:Putative uncharacterized protein encoded by FER1L6-AS2 n=1 Tax=Homo sapiens TaxID=9606 RepID=FEAS2_HUMAN|nr:RecName: Full=Putative uncharacterized protein encoded by FER1L6-AS2; AltName: Full=FER1L6 antisense RNA 2; AltName: Full=FER1L6 antisense gene protein 2 [Homo sapiens]EAW92056.1 chromosome 8 open reading frame 78, isoform CRA_a [Homo sapiens]EAW92057.1 chromosome 8 open reading frame 78, isoform CRA_a [Homo sapiens]